ncbi:hypothetical protein ACFV1L_24610 [Kitasatospora sp. NPDC059646]|uniref:hypothetical protein n=1 Tax=Kitasatospora sp. NPDC059646 TaxID=3346893 RepID=UPI00368A895A
MRTAGRAAWNAALAALLGGAVFFGDRKLADFAHRTHGQAAVPLLVLLVLITVHLTWVVRRDDPALLMTLLGAIATAMLFVHISVLDSRALREHGLEQHARITRVQTKFNADNTDYQVYTLEALDGPPITGTATGTLGGSRRVGETVTVTTDPSGQVAPTLGGLPSAAEQLWMGRLDTALAVLLVPVLIGWTRERTRKHSGRQQD